MQDRIYLEVMANDYLVFNNAESKLLFAGWTWVTLGSNKLKEKTIYDEKQRVAITEQRQYDLLSSRAQCDTANQIKYGQTFNFKPQL